MDKRSQFFTILHVRDHINFSQPFSNNVFLLEIDGGIKCSEFNSRIVEA